MGIKLKFKIFRAVSKALGGKALTDEDVCLIEEGLDQGIPLKDKQLQQLKDCIQKKKLERLGLPRDQNLAESDIEKLMKGDISPDHYLTEKKRQWREEDGAIYPLLQRDHYLSTSRQTDGGCRQTDGGAKKDIRDLQRRW
ncbi:hypothetical protein KA005_23630 [bacterium]|nr:hypothetical protein [bacterium]